jgi:hypothetical protein
MASCPPLRDVITALVSAPFDQLMSTMKLPRATSPLTLPVGTARGRAGRRWTTLWLWSSISAMPDVKPKLPSIWKAVSGPLSVLKRLGEGYLCRNATTLAQTVSPWNRRA